MKLFTQYLQEMNKVYEFKIKIAGCDVDSKVQEQLKSALEMYAVDSIGKPSRLAVQQHSDFPNMGPCECHIIDVGLKYPTTSDQLTQVIANKLSLPRSSVLVRNKYEDELRTAKTEHKKDKNGSVLTLPELEDVPGAQELVGEKRKESMLKELETRKYEMAAKDSTKPVKAMPQGTLSPVGSNQNSVPTRKGKK